MIQQAIAQVELSETFSQSGITFNYPKGMHIENTSKTASVTALKGSYVSTSRSNKMDHTLVISLGQVGSKESGEMMLDGFFSEVKNGLPEGVGVERGGNITVQRVDGFEVNVESFRLVASGNAKFTGMIGAGSRNDVILMIYLQGSDPDTVNALFPKYLSSFSYKPSASSSPPSSDQFQILTSVLDETRPILTIVVVAGTFYLLRRRSKKRMEKALAQLSSQPLSDGHSERHPLRCMEIRSLSQDKASCLLFEKEKILVARLGLSMDAGVGMGTDTRMYGDLHKLLAEKSEEDIMKVAKGSYSILYVNISKVELKKGKLGDRVIEIYAVEGKRRFRTGEDLDRINDAFSLYLKEKFSS